MQFVHGRALSEQLRTCISGSRIDIAVAFWGAGAHDLLGLGAALPGSRIICDAYSGACNPNTLKALLAAGFDVRFFHGLHAKVYISEAMAVVGSANASANGLGRESDELELGLEAGMVVSDAAPLAQARQWFDSLFAKSERLRGAGLNEIQRLWRKRRQSRPGSVRPKLTLEQAILANDRCLDDRRFFVVVYEPEEPTAEVKVRFEETPYHDAEASDPNYIPYFWDAKAWRCQVDDLILSFEVAGAKIEFDAMCRVQARIDGGFILPVEQVARPLNLRFSQSQGRQLARLVTKAVGAGLISVPSGLIPISKLSSALRQLASE
jgi:hypothetical protein